MKRSRYTDEHTEHRRRVHTPVSGDEVDWSLPGARVVRVLEGLRAKSGCRSSSSDNGRHINLAV